MIDKASQLLNDQKNVEEFLSKLARLVSELPGSDTLRNYRRGIGNC